MEFVSMQRRYWLGIFVFVVVMSNKKKVTNIKYTNTNTLSIT